MEAKKNLAADLARKRQLFLCIGLAISMPNWKPEKQRGRAVRVTNGDP
jgi:hypothetical protein